MRGLSQESRRLIDAARDGDNPSGTDRKRVRAALARKIAVGAAVGAVAATATHAAAGGVVAAGTSGAAAGTAGAGVVAASGAASAAGGATSLAAATVATGFGAKLLLTVAIVGAVSAGTIGYTRLEATKRAVADAQVVAVERSAVKSAPVQPSTGRPGAQPTFRASPPIVAVPAVPAAPVAPSPSSLSKPSPATLPPSSAPAQAATASSPLDVEIALLQDANAALREKDGARALRLLDEHSRRFPNGALAEESEAARVFALCQVGRANEARDVAGRFLREHPRSPLAPRVTRACDAEPSTF